ncbi:hypothetical protein ACFVDU_31030 [Streptomyces albidoflavus]
MSLPDDDPVAPGVTEPTGVDCPEQLAEDLLDALLVLTRAAGDTGERFTFDEVLERFGLTRADLDDQAV